VVLSTQQNIANAARHFSHLILVLFVLITLETSFIRLNRALRKQLPCEERKSSTVFKDLSPYTKPTASKLTSSHVMSERKCVSDDNRKLNFETSAEDKKAYNESINSATMRMPKGKDDANVSSVGNDIVSERLDKSLFRVGKVPRKSNKEGQHSDPRGTVTLEISINKNFHVHYSHKAKHSLSQLQRKLVMLLIFLPIFGIVVIAILVGAVISPVVNREKSYSRDTDLESSTYSAPVDAALYALILMLGLFQFYAHKSL